MNTTNRTNRNHNAVRAAAFEALESRQMMSVSWSAGALTINGSNGNDNIVVDCQDYLPGISQIRVHENGAVTQNWTLYQNAKGLTVYGNAGNDTIDLSAVKFGAVVFGGANNDMIKGTKAADAIYGNEGDDALYGNGGGDTLDGGANDDTLVGGAGADALWGGTGTDKASYAERTNPVYVAIDGQGYDGEVGEYDNVHTDVENLTGGLGNDVLAGSSAANVIEGNGGSDILHGGAGKDVLFGGMVLNNAAKNNTGIDSLFGDAGDDQLWAPSGGIGLMHGGADNDTLFGSKQSDDLYGDGGNDSLFGGDGNDNLYGGVGIDSMYGGDGADVLVAVGGGNSNLHGEGNQDTFWIDDTELQSTDYTVDELNAGRVHRVNVFEDYNLINGQNIIAVAVSKDPLGQNLPDPGVASGTAYSNFGNSPLFGPGGPSPDDIHQGELGDCWYVSALSSVARKNPGHLQNQAVPFGDGTFIVQVGDAVNAKYVRVDADFPADSNGDLLYAHKGAGGSIWPSVFEKAEAVVHGKVSSYEMIVAGSAHLAYADLGGSDIKDQFWNDKALGDALSEPKLLKTIDDLLAAGNVVGFGTMDSVPAKQLVVPTHAYSVVKVNKDANGNRVSVTLRNPWGYDGSGLESGNPDDGYVTLNAHDAWVAMRHLSSGKF
jgi:Ca2+-binding RTX toxin-like protein